MNENEELFDNSSLKCQSEYLNGNSLTLQEPELVPDEFDDPMQHQTLAIEYFGRAYEAYLEGADAPFPDQLQTLEDRYGMPQDVSEKIPIMRFSSYKK
jgi:hypothetical protein